MEVSGPYKEAFCELAKQTQFNFTFILIQSITLLCTWIGMLLTIAATFYILSTQVFHINLRILMVNLATLAILRAVLSTHRSAGYLLRAITVKNGCDLVTELSECRRYSSLVAAPNRSIQFAFLAIAIERTVATILYKNYERRECPLITACFAAATWFKVVISTYKSIFYTTTKGTESYLPYCSSLTVGLFSYAASLATQFPIILTTFVVFLTIFYISKRKLKLCVKSNVENLTSRYQTTENMKTCRIMMLLSLTYTGVTLSYLAILMLIHQIATQNLTAFAQLKTVSNISDPIYTVISSLTLLTKVEPIRNRIIHSFHISRRSSVQREPRGISPSTVDHMKILKDLWSKK